MKLDEKYLEEMIPAIRELLAVGLTPGQVRKIIMDAQQQSGLKEQRGLIKAYNRHFKVALARASRLPPLEETCHLCGTKTQVCGTCSICGRRVCKECSNVHFENRPRYTAPVPVVTCKNCSGGDN